MANLTQADIDAIKSSVDIGSTIQNEQIRAAMQKVLLDVDGGGGDGNIVLETEKAIKSANGNGQLNLDIDGGTDEVMLSTDGGLWNGSYIYMSPYGGEFYIPNPDSGTNNLLLYAGSQQISINTGVNNKIDIDTPVLTFSSLPTYADNAAAVSGGHPVNGVYKTATGELRIRI